MIKKLLPALLFIICSYVYGQTIHMTTTSNTEKWSPFNIVKSGAKLTWTASNPLIGTIIINENQPIFDFGLNDGSDISITITSPDGFGGLTVFDLKDRYNGRDVNGIPSLILVKDLDISAATELKELSTQYNRLTSLNLSSNKKLEILNVRGKGQLSSGIDLSNNAQLRIIIADVTALSYIDLSKNPLLVDVRLYDSELTSSSLDQVIKDLDKHNLSGGKLRITLNPGNLTSNSYLSYNHLIAKGWSIDVPAPEAGAEVPVVGILNNPSNITQNTITLSWSAGTDNEDVTNYKIYKNGVLETQVGNVLTYQVTGLTPNTNYNFHITALDSGGLESNNSNTVQGTTLQTVDTRVPVVGILNNPSNITQNTMTLSWSAGTDNEAVTNYKIYKNGVLETQVGNVLTYLVTGLTPNTSYNFHITAIDSGGLESNNSNTVQGTTLRAPTGDAITITTTSSNAIWSPQTVTKSGGILTWTATGTGLAGSPMVITANDPTFNFSSNNGSPIIIKVTSPDGFNGLTTLDLWVAPSGGLISVVDLTSAAALTILNTRYNPLTSLDLSSNVAIEKLIIRGNRQLNNQALNTANNTKLTYLQIDVTGINSVDLSNNKLLKDVRLYDARLTSLILDKVLIDLDRHGLSNGNVQIASQTTGQSITSAAFVAYNNLKAKGWTIDVAVPQSDKQVPISGILNNPSNITQNTMTLSWSAGTDNEAVTNYKIYKNGVLETQVGNVLTYLVTGLTPNTSYNFHITAIDSGGLESNNSNTVQGTTLRAPTGDAITITTTSSNAIWSPQTVTKSGGILTWTATGTGLAGSPMVITANDPTFNFSSNNGSPIIIKVTSPDGFNGLTTLDLWVAPSGGLISVVDLTSAAALTILNTRYNPLTSLDLSSNVAIEKLIIRGNRQLNNQALNTANNTKLTYLQIDVTGINSVDLSNNKLLKDVRLYDARLTSLILDKVLIDLDRHGLSNGNVQIASQTTGQSITSAAFVAYNNLKAKGWTIDVAAPPPILLKGTEVFNNMDGIVKESSFSIFNLNDGFTLGSSIVMKEVKVYDLLGRILITSKPNQLRVFLSGNFIKTGSILIFQVEFENGTLQNKKAIKL